MLTRAVGKALGGVAFGALLLFAAVPADAFYLPGVAPTDYSIGSPMNVKVCSASCPELGVSHEPPVLQCARV